MKKIKSKDRLIVALDFDKISKAQELVEKLGDEVTFYKVGLELMMSGNYFKLIKWLEKRNKRVFADLKLYDISVTVGKAIKNLSNYSNIDFVTIHAANEDIMLEASRNKGNMHIIAVTVLTCLSQNDLKEMCFDEKLSIRDVTITKAKFAKKCNIDGVVSSGLEVKYIKDNIGNDFLVITPGIRPNFLDVKNDDQKRVVDVEEAFKNGADYIVVGRPIIKDVNPVKIARQIQEQIEKIFRT